jgi:hypothetical protein
MKSSAWIHIAFYSGGNVQCERCGKFTEGAGYSEGHSWTEKLGKSPKQKLCIECLLGLIVPLMLAASQPPAPPSFEHPERN